MIGLQSLHGKFDPILPWLYTFHMNIFPIFHSLVIVSRRTGIQNWLPSYIGRGILCDLNRIEASQSFKLFKTKERSMVEKYNSIIGLWRRISTISRGLRYGDAMKLLSLLEDASSGFTDFVKSTIAALHPVHCTREREVEIDLDLTTIPAFIIVFVILWFVLRPRRPKPKIN